ncbi:ribonuclease R [Halocynthiibacter styelae]|uniref:Ribonuclease R n=1 Tax=Halocynthiibacter styelae TaxID=2761955 RepID=A0A8J7IXI3_9RHOB|nr:ribonuclease R [Paenihalocynthiibacter styelae]MBI1493900.1 ribonuclease R [Paenihalocynthiibacter styelae]
MTTRIPSKEEILNWISENPARTAKRDIARAFGIKGAARIDLKRILKELEAEGHLRKRKKTYRESDKLPPVAMLKVEGPDADGDLFAYPVDWQGEDAAPRVLMLEKPDTPALAKGARILARLQETEGEDYAYNGVLIRQIGSNPQRILGIYRSGHEGGRIVPVEKGSDKEWKVPAGATLDAKDGELVEAERTGPKSRMGLPSARIVDRLGDPTAPKAVSLIAIHQHGIPDAFPDEVVAEADAAKPAPLDGREDLRDMPLITIDPHDARDHDDACFAHADSDVENPGGHIVWVAIADVAHYVTPGSELDREARKRGNSSYFPDRVVPMLPDRLSGDLCSLHEGVDRACIAVRMQLDAEGNKISHRFTRALMKSHASLNYQEVQQAMDGNPNDRCAELLSPVLEPLYAAWHATLKARDTRQPLELDLPERKIILDEDGKVKSVAFAERLDAHKLIEEFMVLANVAAAEELIARKQDLLFRVHEEPNKEKLDALRETAQASGLTLAKGQVLKTAHLNRLLNQAQDTDHAELINISTLRSMTQAYYGPDNFGHFGLALRSYAHFTSPIRRYADLLVHRALISGHKWEGAADKFDGMSPFDEENLRETGTQISETERRSMTAERDTTDRYLAAFLSERVGNELEGKISGIARFGAFIRLEETGADALVPVATIGQEYFHFDADDQSLTGDNSGLRLGIGQAVTVRLAEAIPVTGGLVVELLALNGQPLPRGRGGRGSRSFSSKRSGKKPKSKSGKTPGTAPARKKARKVVRKRKK